jgi:gliding-associated putative ABC transporter substrate-binding component GldG
MLNFDYRKSMVLPAAILLVAILLLNLIARNWYKRYDFTDTKMYSLSSSTEQVIKKIDDLLNIKVYFSENLPGEYGNNRRYLQDILEEYAAISKGKIRFEFFVPDSDDELEKEAQKSGVQPVQLQVIEKDEAVVKKVFMGVAIYFEDKREVIPVVLSTTGLEYEITTRIKKLVEKDKKFVGMVEPDNEDIQTNTFSQILRQRYEVRPLDLSNEIPNNINVLILTGIKDSLDVKKYDHLNKFINNGGNIFVALNPLSVDLQTQRAEVFQSDIFDLLRLYGFTLTENLILDKNCGRVNVMQDMGFMRMNVPMEYPFLPIIRTFNKEESLVSGLEQVHVFFSTEIQFDSVGVNVNRVPLFSSSNKSGVMTGFYNLSPDPKQNPQLKNLNQPGKVVAARSDLTSNETGLISQLILVADNRFLTDDGGGAVPENHIFMMNAIDFLMGDKDLMALRSREITDRSLNEELVTDDARSTWKWINGLLPSLLIVGFGFWRLQMHKRTMKLIEEMYD